MSIHATSRTQGGQWHYADMAAPFLPLLLLPVAYGVSRYAAAYPAWAEEYALFVTRYIASPVSRALGIFPFSVAEVLLVLCSIQFVLSMVFFVYRRDWIRLVATPLAVASVLYALFAAGWGVAYSRMPYADAAGLTVSPVSVEELEELYTRQIDRANELRRGAQEDRDGVYRTGTDAKGLLKRVDEAYDDASGRYPWLDGKFGDPKPVMLSEAMNHMHISGIFIPFTFEANVNINIPEFFLPVTACHEGAHLRGWAREDEANYIAYAVCMESGDADFTYSGTILGLINAGNALADADMERYRALQARIGEGVRRDIDANSAHWEKYEGELSRTQERVNDAYLKANRQEDGVRSYGRMIDLMVAEMRNQR